MKRRHRVREPWELWARPVLALVFIVVYRLAACGADDHRPTLTPPQPPAWVEEQGYDQRR